MGDARHRITRLIGFFRSNAEADMPDMMSVWPESNARGECPTWSRDGRECAKNYFDDRRNKPIIRHRLFGRLEPD